VVAADDPWIYDKIPVVYGFNNDYTGFAADRARVYAMAD
jgi:hypothetical protein